MLTIFLLTAFLLPSGGAAPAPTAMPNAADIPPTPILHPEDGILLGAIRWDAWYGGSHYVKNLFPKEWRYRLPFYAAVSEDGQVQMASDSQEVMDQEIRSSPKFPVKTTA